MTKPATIAAACLASLTLTGCPPQPACDAVASEMRTLQMQIDGERIGAATPGNAPVREDLVFRAYAKMQELEAAHRERCPLLPRPRLSPGGGGRP